MTSSSLYSIAEIGLIYGLSRLLSLDFTTFVAVWALVTANILYVRSRT